LWNGQEEGGEGFGLVVDVEVCADVFVILLQFVRSVRVQFKCLQMLAHLYCVVHGVCETDNSSCPPMMQCECHRHISVIGDFTWLAFLILSLLLE